MTIPQQGRKKFYALRGLALLLLIFAGAILIWRPHEPGLRPLALAAILVSVWLVRRADASIGRGQFSGGWRAQNDRRVGPLAWALMAASLVACGVCYYLMIRLGGNEVWPVYAFAASGLALVLTSGYVVLRLSR